MPPRKKPTTDDKPASSKKKASAVAPVDDNSTSADEKMAVPKKRAAAADWAEKPATKKRATAAMSEDDGTTDAAELVMGYLRKVNRPYSAIEISANLHNKVSKAATAKILKDLHERNQLEGRSAGKQIVYHVHQDPADAYSPEQLAALDTTIADLRTNTTTLITTAKTLRTTFTSLNSTLSTADLVANVTCLEAEKDEIVNRLETLKAGKVKVTKKEREQVEKDWKDMVLAEKRRDKIAVEMWKLIEDFVEGKEKREELREALGLDD